jgi:hypothetical protein
MYRPRGIVELAFCQARPIDKTDYGSGVPRNFFGGGGGFQQTQLRIEGRENGDLGAVAP